MKRISIYDRTCDRDDLRKNYRRRFSELVEILGNLLTATEGVRRFKNEVDLVEACKVLKTPHPYEDYEGYLYRILNSNILDIKGDILVFSNMIYRDLEKSKRG